jgi:serine/threonine protein kinase
MGAVYMARDKKRHGALCAIKEMSLSMIPPAEQDRAIQNFKNEARMLWGLDHPNLPAFNGFFLENQRYFLVMEYIDGMTLEELLDRNRGPFSERRVLGWARQLCDVLEYLHSQNPPIIFRDMKPNNIMLTRNGNIKLIDFGIARFFRPTGTHDTQNLGTPGFAPPEQYGGSQTDTRSDIYSLAMTLFLLLTNTLSEHEFCLKNIRANYPNISPVVARALEKATSYEPEDRYNSVAEFRSALLGVGFVFDSGDLAVNPEELADLCERFPEEAAEYLFAGEIEAWLHEIGYAKLARTAQNIRMQTDDALDAVESLLEAIMGHSAHLQAVQPANGRYSGMRRSPVAELSSLHSKNQSKVSVRTNPERIEFGPVYSGSISDPLMFSITNDQGYPVSGVVYANNSWITLDQTHFEGRKTHVSVRINSTKLHRPGHYAGSITILPDNESTQDGLVLPVEVDVLGGGNELRDWVPTRRAARTAVPDLDAYKDDEDEDEDDYAVVATGAMPEQDMQDATADTTRDKESEYRTKYGPQGGIWELARMSLRQHLWRQRGLTFMAAFMLTTMVYNLASQAAQPPLPPYPQFVLVLVGAIPAATAGALIVNWVSAWRWKETINRASTGMAATLAILGAIQLVSGIIQLPSLLPPAAYLTTMLLIAALSATIGITRSISDAIIDGSIWTLRHLNRKGVVIGTTMLGGILGACLSTGFAFTILSWLSILLGLGVGFLLPWHSRRLLKTHHL